MSKLPVTARGKLCLKTGIGATAYLMRISVGYMLFSARTKALLSLRGMVSMVVSGSNVMTPESFEASALTQKLAGL